MLKVRWGEYGNNLKRETIQNMQTIKIRNVEEEEEKWISYLHLKKFRKKRRQTHWKTCENEQCKYYDKKNDRHLFSDDTIIKTNKLSEIYEKLTNYEKVTKKYKIKINWNKVKIIVRKKMLS